ncbi:V-type proton ATPase subunit S1-like [Dromiciops gliroides]|uniref:V-type proton ATPase subunit S1-like n=1 Tax=Dromiciops gliroides TaxID=33562 RepID=UPI001CC388FF|nr:V-type proton ATPase subunit S1-like [Dromiciops gliroides]
MSPVAAVLLRQPRGSPGRRRSRPLRGLLLLQLLLLAPRSEASDPQVPLLLWSSSPGLRPSVENPYEGHIYTRPELYACLEPILEQGPHTVLMILQEKLRLEDFTAFGEVLGDKPESPFPNLQEVLERAPTSLVLPAVSWAAAATLTSYLTQKLGTGPVHVDQASLRGLKLNTTRPLLLLVYIPSAASTDLGAHKEALASQDQILGQVLGRLQEEGKPYTALLTALRPSRAARDLSLVSRGLGQQLLGESQEYKAQPAWPPALPPVSYSDTEPRILFWARHFLVSYEGQTQDLTSLTFGAPELNLTGSSWNDSSAQLVMTYNNLFGPFLRLRFSMVNHFYPGSHRSWFTMEGVEIKTHDSTAFFSAVQVAAPSTYSYHCQYVSSDPTKWGLLMPHDLRSPWSVTFQDFQIQAFNLSGGSFSGASDCAAFFSPAIWMGLVSSLFMLFCITFGVHIIFKLKSLNRFDEYQGDPLFEPLMD